METIKSFTSIEQSKVLAEILPLESADMHYSLDIDPMEHESVPTVTEEDDHFELFQSDIPCWSLAALLSILPQPHLERFDKNTWICSTFNKDNHFIDNASENDPVDACYEMIVRLHKEFKTVLSWIAQAQEQLH